MGYEVLNRGAKKDDRHLYCWLTQNVHKVLLFLEETQIPYRLLQVDIGRGDMTQRMIRGRTSNCGVMWCISAVNRTFWPAAFVTRAASFIKMTDRPV